MIDSVSFVQARSVYPSGKKQAPCFTQSPEASQRNPRRKGPIRAYPSNPSRGCLYRNVLPAVRAVTRYPAVPMGYSPYSRSVCRMASRFSGFTDE